MEITTIAFKDPHNKTDILSAKIEPSKPFISLLNFFTYRNLCEAIKTGSEGEFDVFLSEFEDSAYDNHVFQITLPNYLITTKCFEIPLTIAPDITTKVEDLNEVIRLATEELPEKDGIITLNSIELGPVSWFVTYSFADKTLISFLKNSFEKHKLDLFLIEPEFIAAKRFCNLVQPEGQFVFADAPNYFISNDFGTITLISSDDADTNFQILLSLSKKLFNVDYDSSLTKMFTCSDLDIPAWITGNYYPYMIYGIGSILKNIKKLPKKDGQTNVFKKFRKFFKRNGSKENAIQAK